jgi:putative membrane protein
MCRVMRARRMIGPVGDRVALSIIGVLSAAIVGVVGVLLLAHDPGRPLAAEVAALPALNAALNATCATLLIAGWVAIRRRRIAVHRACMLAACVASALFLVSYVVYHALAGSRPFVGQGWIRAVYFPILVSHIVLAAVMVPFVLTTVYRALSGRFDRHVPIARRTLPMWLYVSVTGVLVYVLLYHLG